MDHITAAEDQIVPERFRRKLREFGEAAKSQLSPFQDHINFTLQQAYFKCAYDCFERKRNQDWINNCVEHCNIPVLRSQQYFENEMAQFQERLNRSMMVCQDKFEASKVQKIRPEAVNDMESCVHEAIEDSLDTLPYVVQRMKNAI